MASKHSIHSSYREKLLEHLFVAELLKRSWRDGSCSMEIAKPEVDSKGLVKISGSYIPLRGSITRFFGRYYLSPRVGVYLPVGDFKNEAGFSPSFGIAPRFGYFFPISREIQFDFAFEYDYLLGDQTFHYAGVSMGLFFGGRNR